MPEDYDMATINKVNLLFADVLLLEDDNYIICGEYDIVDLAGGNANHIPKFQPTHIKKMNKVYEKAYPSRPKALFIINPPSVFEGVFKLVQPFLSEKIRSRVRYIQYNHILITYATLLCSCITSDRWPVTLDI